MAAPTITLPSQSMCWPSDLATLTVHGDRYKEVRVRLQVVGAWSYEATLYTDYDGKAVMTGVDRILIDCMHDGTLADYTDLDVLVGAGGEGTELTLQGTKRVLLFDGYTPTPARDWCKHSFLLLGNERTVPADVALAPCELHWANSGGGDYYEYCAPYTVYYLANAKTGESRRVELQDDSTIDMDDDQGSHTFNPSEDVAIQDAGLQAEAADWVLATVQHRLGLRVFTMHVQHKAAATLDPLRVEFINAFGYADTLYLFGERVVEHKYDYTTATVGGTVRTLQVTDVPTIKAATGPMQWRSAAAVQDLCRAHKIWLVDKNGVRTPIFVSAAEHKAQAAPGEPLEATLSLQYCTPYPIIDDGDGLTYDTTPAVFDNSFA